MVKQLSRLLRLACCFALGLSCFALFPAGCELPVKESKTPASSEEPLVVGVYHLSDPSKRFEDLKRELEEKLGIQTAYVELIPEQDDGEPSRVKFLSKLLRESRIDLVLGAPHTYTQQLIHENLFMDLTDHIENIDQLQPSVVDVALKVGGGRIYTISPVIAEWYGIFENKSLLDELGIEPIDRFINWNEFGERLDRIRDAIARQDKDIKPLAMVVQNEGEENVFIEDAFLMYGYGLDAPVVEDNILLGNPKWADFFLTFSELVEKYGESYANVDQRYLFDTHFSTGQYVTALGGFYHLELFTGDHMQLNRFMPARVEVNFDLNIVPLPVYPGDEGMLNIRLSSMAVSESSRKKAEALKVLNYILGKEFAMSMLNHRYAYNQMGFGVPFFPAYYDEEVIDALNKTYRNRFDVSWIYKAAKGSVTCPVYDMNKRETVYRTLNQAFSDVYNHKTDKHEALKNAQIPVFP